MWQTFNKEFKSKNLEYVFGNWFKHVLQKKNGKKLKKLKLYTKEIHGIYK